jgi:hypothetical protein
VLTGFSEEDMSAAKTGLEGYIPAAIASGSVCVVTKMIERRLLRTLDKKNFGFKTKHPR